MMTTYFIRTFQLSLFQLIALFTFCSLNVSSIQAAESTLEDQLKSYDRDDIHSIHKKLYTKRGRHEFTLGAGGIVSNGGLGLFTLGYTYHFFENFGFEAATGGYAFQTGGNSTKLLFYQGSLTFSPLYGKMSLFTWAVMNFDLYFVGGAGAVKYSGLRDGSSFMGNIGIGERLFINDYLSVKVEYRDYIYKQQVTNADRVIHNHSILAGVSLLFPFRQAY